MAKGPSDNGKLVPAYIPFTSFRTFIENLNDTAIPPRIDSSVMPSMSGQTRSALNSCLRFLNLIDENREVTDRLKPLVDAFGTGEWKSALGGLIAMAYAPILDGLKLTHATGAQLNERFREASGIDGQVLEKAVRFLLSALDEAGVAYSPHFKTRGARTVRKRQGSQPKLRKQEAGADLGNGDGDDLLEQFPDEGLVRFEVPFPDKPWARLWVPRDLSLADWDMIDAIGRAYVKRNSPKIETTNA